MPVSDHGALLRPRRLRGVELPVALFDAASALVPGNGAADMIRANPLACSGDFLLRLAACQGKDLIAEARRVALADNCFRGCGPRAPARSHRSDCLRWRGRRLGGGRLFYVRAFAVTRKYTLSRLQLAELAGQLLALRIDARQRLADPLLLFGDLVQCRHSRPSRTEYRLTTIDQSFRRLALRCTECNSRTDGFIWISNLSSGKTSRVRVERDIDAQFRARQLAPKTEQQFRMAVLHLAKSSRMECITRRRWRRHTVNGRKTWRDYCDRRRPIKHTSPS